MRTRPVFPWILSALVVCLGAGIALRAVRMDRKPAAGSTSSRSVSDLSTGNATPPGAKETVVESGRLNPAELDSALRCFRQWTRLYTAAKNPAERTALLDSGKNFATAHRQAMKQLIAENPRRALEKAVPAVTRQQLPAEILSQIEERINARGTYRVVASWPAESEAAVQRVVETGGTRYEAFVFGRRLTQTTSDRAYLSGVAVGRSLALDERPFRVMEPGEIPGAAKEVDRTCPVSGESVPVADRAALPPVTEKTPAVEAGGVIHYLCSGGHIAAFEKQLIAYEGGTGGPVSPSGAVPGGTATGVKSILYVRVAFSDTRVESQTEAEACTMMEQVNDWYVKSSYGALYFLTTVSPLVILSHPEAYYTSESDHYGLRADALAAAAEMGYDASAFDFDIVIYSGGPGNFNGAASIGSRGVWLKVANPGIACHELGHNLGLYHANSWYTSGRSIIGDGYHIEYGNGFDTMAAAAAGPYQFNAAFKSQLGWLTREFVHDIRRSGLYRIHAFDQTRLDPANRYAFKVSKDGERDYWGEYRQEFGSVFPTLRDGVLLNWSPWSKSAGGTHLLDTTPDSPDGVYDAALTIGRTFSDFGAGVHITPVGKGGTVPGSLDLVVNLGA
ncbi:MAG TPA: hypothetical protein VHM91_10200, partial [Verrucomicrobiales bacterium]|nr:hypothetical protein [Verrucomicrobiales bacterium]